MSRESDGVEEVLSSREQELVETIPTPVWRAAPEGNEYVNKRALEYFGAPADEILGKFTPTTLRSR
jgi:PAS domain-containing protein